MLKLILIALIAGSIYTTSHYNSWDGEPDHRELLLEGNKAPNMRHLLNYGEIPPTPAKGTWTLERDYNEEQLTVVNLTSALTECAGGVFGQGTRCPQMSRCQGGLSKVQSCVEPQFQDPMGTLLQALNGAGGSPAFEGRIFQVDDALVNHRGLIFDDQILIDHGGCRRPDFLQHPAGRVVKSLSEGFVAVHDYGINYYHLMAELLSGVFQARQFILAHPHVPLIVKKTSKIDLVLRVLRLEQVVKVVYIDKSNGLIHLNRTYVPIKTECFKASHVLWREFRDFYYSRSVPEILGERKPRVVEGLKIVVAKRTKSRAIKGFDLLIEKLRSRIKGGELVIFRGDEGLDRSMEMFSDATIFVGGHGAGLTNMMFMPDNGAVLEILPDQYQVLCYQEMSAAIGLGYHMILGAGDKNTSLKVDLDLVVNKVAELAARFPSRSS